MSKILEFKDLVAMNQCIEHANDNDGETITRMFNDSCEIGLEVNYLGDSTWEFVSEAEAEQTLDTMEQKDRKRCGIE